MAAMVAISSPGPRLMLSKPENVRLVSSVDVPPVAIERLLLPDWALIVSVLPLPPIRLLRPVTEPEIAVAPAAAVAVADDRLMETEFVYPA